MANPTIRIDLTSQGRATVTLDRPEVHNAIDDALIAELTAGLRKLADDAQVRVVVLAAEGRSFCAGADLQWMRRSAEYSSQQNLEDALALAEMLRVLDTLPKPTVAVVQGAAYGGGVGLVACCDIAIASDEATFSFSEVRLGLIPAAISPYVLAAIGARHARRYFLTAERFSAADAQLIGLVHELAAPESLGTAVDAVIEEITRGGPEALRTAKELIRDVSSRLGDQDLPKETAKRIAEIRAGEEAKQGIEAFLGKVKPPWQT